MNRLKRYENYKDSGVEWLGEIPEHWEIDKLKNYCKAFGRIGFRGYNTSDLVNESEGAITISPSNIFEYSMTFNKCSFLRWEKYYESPEIQIEENDILIVKTGSTFGKIGMVKNLPEKATINPQLLVLKDIKIEQRFFYYMMTSSVIQTQVNQQVIGSTIPTISESKILNFVSILPSKEEQRKIASFLDDKTAQIDEVISQKEKLIELLKERKQIVINDAVTKGLDKDVEFVDSDVEWIGKIPKHWEVIKFKHLFYEKKKIHDISLNCGSISFGKVVEKNDEKIPASTKASYQVLNKGEFLINPLNLNYDLKSLRIGLSDLDVVVSSGYIIIKNKENIDKIYFNWLLHRYDIAFMKTLGAGVRQTLNFGDIAETLLVNPPIDEQMQIAEYIENQTTKIDIAIELQQNYISKLKEYKASLIDSVVTGKVKVS
ncbi:restriction endonuclease subunit S [Aliarcobacter cryaerophilus]|uniref:restriction endonuclease subunit S n=1 Tax=Aliarcobacter cryaerophilus TaxID=28198 RepID=UPI0021B2D0D7|nr:restriction endonuclease subunit S [Aliarcobacter cryaerophilus]MCT7465681.1 restriction endonuclease subunit S [Aliarcobacter cryaerophilus]MCT7494828.1 restriction endonuclease subunit S [Aliarcobacter cryaerophilus]